jgi:hypothetical protein
MHAFINIHWHWWWSIWILIWLEKKNKINNNKQKEFLTCGGMPLGA